VNLSGLDLNLLVTFDALMKERSVSRAARRVGLSQPATSNALARLRALFDDPLLVRHGNRMVPTERALALVGHVHTGLTHLSAALEGPRAFDPATARLVFNVSANDYACFVLLSQLVERLHRDAPGITLRVVPMNGASPVRDRMDRGEVDLGFTLHSTLPDGVMHQELFDDGYVCLVRTGHPRVGRRLTLRQYVSLEHLLISPFGSMRGMVDTALTARSLERHIALYVPNFLLAPPILAQTDLITTIASRVGRAVAAPYALRVLAPPLRIRRFSMSMFWDPRHEHVAAHRWLREQVLDAAEGLDD